MAQTAAQKKATAAKDAIIMQKAMEARGLARQTAAAKEKTYVESLENPITSQYDPRIAKNAGFDPEKVGVMTGSEGMTPEQKATAVAASGKSTVVDTDALARLNMQLTAWGIGDLSNVITKLLQQGFDENTVMSRIKYDTSPIDPNNPKGAKWNDAYTTRFAGNAARVAKGLNAYDEREYLQIENTYEETLKRFGLGTMLSTDRKTNQAKFASYMANDLAAPEFAERIKEVSQGVLMMDAATKNQWKTYYPSLTDNDIVAYFLDPKQTLPILEQKVIAAQIGAVAGTSGYGITKERAEEFAKFNVSRADALTGYQQVAEAVPTGKKLSGIYGEENIQYGQTQAEDEFLKSDAQAKLKRNRLASKERAMFSGSSGVDSGSLSKPNLF